MFTSNRKIFPIPWANSRDILIDIEKITIPAAPKRLSKRSEKYRIGSSLMVANARDSPIKVLLASKSFIYKKRKLLITEEPIPNINTVNKKRDQLGLDNKDRNPPQNFDPMPTWLTVKFHATSKPTLIRIM